MTDGRACDGCSLCCTLLGIPELQKPMFVRCPHVVAGRGCGIYGQRPTVCRTFDCLWLQEPGVPDHWQPTRSHMILAGDPTGTLLSVLVDAGHEEAWRAQPYYGDLKMWAAKGIVRVQVLTRKHGWVVFPEEDLFIGERQLDDEIVGFGYKQQGMMKQPAVAVRHGDGTTREVLGGLYPMS